MGGIGAAFFTTFAPQLPQNAASGSNSSPQAAQRCSAGTGAGWITGVGAEAGVPHSEQKLAPSGSTVPQEAQRRSVAAAEEPGAGAEIGSGAGTAVPQTGQKLSSVETEFPQLGQRFGDG